MDIFWFTIIIFFLVGILFNFISSIVGIGGGVLNVAFFTIFISFPINIAIDTSTFVILISSGVGFISYLKQKRTNLKLSLIYSLFSILGSFISTIIFSFFILDNYVLKIIFATVLLLTSVNMMNKAYRTKKKQNLNETPIDSTNENYDLNLSSKKKELKKGIPLFMLAGFLANLIGIGGGVVNVPSLNIVLGYPIHNATAISISIIFFTAIVNTIIKSIYGHIEYLIGLFLGSGTIVGALVGSSISKKIPRFYLQLIVAVVLIILAINMYIPR
ncbi:MAG: sulfite exporter TauE/SafE family protein [Promethearchaeota archaeon]